MRRALPFGLMMLPAATAFAEEERARPEELFLGDHGWEVSFAGGDDHDHDD